MAKSRVFNISQFFTNPKTGETLNVDLDRILEVLHGRKTLKLWAYAIHDKDVYSEADEDNHVMRLREEYDKLDTKTEGGLEEYIKQNQYIFAGQPKPPHIHIVISTAPNRIDAEMLAKWLGIPVNCIEFPKGRGAFEDCVEYLTHENPKEQAKGKHLYADEEIHANFDWRTVLMTRAISKEKYNRDNPKLLEMWVADLQDGTRTLDMCLQEDPILYGQNMALLQRCRNSYLCHQKAPKTRINIYVYGATGGVGKSLASMAIARSIVHAMPGFENIESDRDMFFSVGAENVSFEGYDGQPVIIWDDCDAGVLIKRLGGRRNVYNVFDTHPQPIRQNVKNSSVNLLNRINIINSTQEPEKFIRGLAGEYEDKAGVTHVVDDVTQARRRIVITIFLRYEDYDIRFNKGYFNDTPEFEQYEEYKNIVGNFQNVRAMLSERQALQIEAGMCQIVSDKVNAKLEQEANKADAPDDVLKQFENYGKMTTDNQPIVGEQITLDEFIRIDDDGEEYPFE